MSTIKHEDVYHLMAAMLRGALHVQRVGHARDNARSIALGLKHVKRLAFTHHSGGRPKDMIATTEAVTELISERMAEALQEFTGWSSFEARITGKHGEDIPSYCGLVITGRCGPIDEEHGRALWPPAPPKPGEIAPYRQYLWFDPDSWDGSDIFAPEGTVFCLITRRVMEALKRAKLTNIVMTPLSET